MNTLRELFLTVCFVPALLLALVFVPLFAYSPLIFALVSVLSSVFVTAFGLFLLFLQSDEEARAPRSVVRGTWLASVPLFAFFLNLVVRFCQGAYDLML